MPRVTGPLLAPMDFAARMVGVPWVRWAASWEASDCYGLVVMYWRHVLGVDVGDVPRTDIASGFAGIRGWSECGPEPGACGFMTWRDGAPTHCGVLLPGGMLLHAQEDGRGGGSVRMTRLAVMARACPDLRFYRFTPC